MSYYAAAIEKRDPIIVHDLESCDVCTGFEHHLRSQSLRNLLLCPLYLGDDLVGMLELGSPNPGDMNAFNSLKLMKIADLFATAMSRSIEEREDRVQAIIKQQYTAIHPSVEWRFRDAASNYVAAVERGDQPQVEEIVFSDVYPLYGLSDIRGSSTKRNAAIQADLGEQLGYALEVVEEARIYRPLPILDELLYRVQRYVEQVRTGLRTDDEHSVIEFLKSGVEPVFDRIAKYGDGVQQKIEQYRAALHPSLGLVYRKRKAFEEALSAIRETVAAKIDEEQEWAQAMFPHYFEKFKTDGVDYTIYVGGSLVGGEEFDPLYLANFRLWQLMMMCRIDVSLRAAKSSLPMELDATHLILVQDVPLSIRFRSDEKQFDVDGAYNIRYEIVKKRIDKAHVRGTQERLTQVGALAIVYSTARESKEYRRYIEYLQSAGYLGDEVEDLELEDMQGVQGLRALRVPIRADLEVELSAEDTELPYPESVIQQDPAHRR